MNDWTCEEEWRVLKLKADGVDDDVAKKGKDEGLKKYIEEDVDDDVEKKGKDEGLKKNA